MRAIGPHKEPKWVPKREQFRWAGDKRTPFRKHLTVVLKPNFWKSLVAVVAGNLLYFFVFYNSLPPIAQHRPFKIDLGLVVDVWICLVFYGIVELIVRLRPKPSRSS